MSAKGKIPSVQQLKNVIREQTALRKAEKRPVLTVSAGTCGLARGSQKVIDSLKGFSAGASFASVGQRATGIGSGGVPVRWEVAGLFLMGQDPFALEQHVANLRSMAFFVGRPWPVEIALWDIIGQASGLVVYARNLYLIFRERSRLRGIAAQSEAAP